MLTNELTEDEFRETEAILRDARADPARARDALGDRFIPYIATKGLRSLYFFNRAILGYAQMVPHLHGELCRFAQGDVLRKGYLIPRGHFKTSTITIGKTLHGILGDPDRRYAIIHEKATQAEQFLAEMQSHLAHNDLLKACYPERIPPYQKRGWRWKIDSFNLPRPRSYPEATVYAAGQTSAFHGMHFTDMVWDDLIGEEAAASSENMQKVIDWMIRAEALSVVPSELRLDLIGTRWAYFDIYQWAMDEGYPSMEWFIRSAIETDDAGEEHILFPERFTMESLLEIKKRNFVMFMQQYQNQPATGETADFEPAWLRYYRQTADKDGEAWLEQEEERDADTSLRVPLAKLDVYIHADPSLGITEGPQKAVARHSRSAIVVLGIAYPRRIYLLHVWAKRLGVDDFIDQLLRYFTAYDRQLAGFSVEKHSWTRIIKPALLQKANERGIPLTESRVKDYKGSANARKDGRIRALQPYFRGGQVFIERSSIDFEREYRDFPMGKQKDILDALAQGPDYWRFPEDEEHDPWYDNAQGTLYDPAESRQDLGASEVTGY